MMDGYDDALSVSLSLSLSTQVSTAMYSTMPTYWLCLIPKYDTLQKGWMYALPDIAAVSICASVKIKIKITTTIERIATL